MAGRWSLVGGLLLAFAAAAGAGPRRVEVVGVSPVDAPSPGPRERALQDALLRAVEGVARTLTDPSALPAGEEGVLAAALGPDPSAFALGYRVLADLGERTAREPALGQERALRVVVRVDADGVLARLRAAGIPVAGGLDRPLEAFFVEIPELGHWSQLEALRRALLEQGGAVVAVPDELEAGRARLRVRAPGGAAALLDRLLAAPPESLRIEPLALQDGTLVLGVAPEPAEPTPFDTQD